MRLHFQDRGSGEPVIVLHGLFGSLDNWHSFNARLSEEYRVYGIDQRNHGRSPHHPNMSYPLMAQDVAEWMREQGITCARVIGHSMGGKTAMKLALDYPGVVQQLVVVDISPKAYPARHAAILEGLLKLDLKALQTRKHMEETLAPWVPNLAVRQFLLKNVAHEQGSGFKWRMGLREIASNYDRLGAAVHASNAYHGPALFVRGEHSDYLPMEDLPLIRHLFPAAEIRSIAGAGHWVHAEAPEQFFQIVEDFFRAKS